MVPSAFRTEVGVTGGSGVSVRVIGHAVVKIAAVGGYSAAGELVGVVSGGDQAGEVGWGPVAGGAVVQWPAGDRVSQDPPPGALRGQVAGYCGGRFDQTAAHIDLPEDSVALVAYLDPAAPRQ